MTVELLLCCVHDSKSSGDRFGAEQGYTHSLNAGAQMLVTWLAQVSWSACQAKSVTDFTLSAQCYLFSLQYETHRGHGVWQKQHVT